MNDDQIPEAEVTEAQPTNAIATRPAQPVSTVVDKPQVTPEQAKVEAVANLTMSAYARASELKLTPEEIQGLEADFEDSDFRPGAAGKENLLYIEHAALRQRLNRVIGNGQWSIIPRKRWAEDFEIPARNRGEAPTKATRIYVEAMLVIRGCFVAEAIGDMVYYPNNQSQNYGDAVEGAKTAALRRCAKEMGIGLQAWKKGWCEGWWERNRGNRPSQNAPGRSGGSQSSTPPPAARPSPQPATRQAATASQVLPQEATDDQRNRFIALFPGTNADYALRFFQSKGWIANTQEAKLADLPLKYVPTTKKAADDLFAQVEAFVTQPPAEEKEAWRSFLKPWGNFKGVPLGEVEKNHLYGLVMNYEVEREFNGQPKSPEKIAEDELFRRMLDDAGRHYGWIKE